MACFTVIPSVKLSWKMCLLAILPFLIACSQSYSPLPQEEDDEYFQRGLAMLRENRPKEALDAFQETIERRREAPESHLEAGRIFLDHLKDPVTAIYHFRKYLEVKPNSDKSALVRQLIETAMKNFAASLPGQPSVGDPDRIDLLARIDQLEAEKKELLRQLAAVRRSQSPAENPTTAPTSTLSASRPSTTETRRESVAPPRSYVVEAGDTLNKISLKVYGNPNRWNDIYQANRDQLTSPHSLKVGQILKIP